MSVDQLFQKLPKDIIIKMIPLIEDQHKRENDELNRSLLMLKNLIGRHHFEERKCNHDNCKEYCFIYSKKCGCNCEGDTTYISTSQNIESDEYYVSADHTYGNDYDPHSNDHFEQYGFACDDCSTWYCTNHWLKNVIQLKTDDGSITFCKSMDMKDMYTVGRDRQYRVSWEGFGPDENTWQLESSLGADTVDGDKLTLNGDKLTLNGDTLTLNGDKLTLNGDGGVIQICK